MMDHALCNQTVTIYRQVEGEISRQVVKNAFFSVEEGVSHHDRAPVQNFLLIVPGPEVGVFPGDRVLPGIGPMDIDWQAFLPAAVPGLVEVGRTRHYRINGKISHTEGEQPWN